MPDRWRGAVLALLAAALFGASIPSAKRLLGAIEPTALAGLLYLGAGVGVGAILTVRARLTTRRAQAPLPRTDWPWLAAIVIAGGLMGPILLMAGLRVTPATSAALLLNLENLFTLLIAWLVFHENVDRRVGLGALAILIGAVFLAWQGDFSTPQAGALAIAGACLAWAIDNNLTRKLAVADPLLLVTVKGLVAGPVTLAIAAALGESFPAPGLAAAAGAIGAIGYGGSLIAFVLALRQLGAARTGAYFATAPFVGAVLAVLWLAEPLTWQLSMAGALMLVGVWLHLTERHDHFHLHDALIHQHRHSHDEHHQHPHEPNDPPGEPHVHEHVHAPLEHTHPHYPDIHHRHRHSDG
ncbi:MAG: EamA family transporter [Candidatus Competibacteraceae bacterium]|nr:EamA family transporter [Candidatus Competibacteraceae bacterium]MBK9951297.1 EamA family transporter [Candidatus Competibacteraceae bacterium]